jgi:hypothetical protein
MREKNSMRPLIYHVTALVFLAGCGPQRGVQVPESGPQAPFIPTAVKQSLVEELQRTVPRNQAYPLEEDLEIKTDSSAVVAGLVYYSASYFPRGTVHVRHQAVVVYDGSHVVILRDPDDWRGAARNWQPSSADAATRACFEVVRFATDQRSSAVPPVLFTSSKVLERLSLPDTTGLRSRLYPPSVSHTDGSWESEMWIIGTPHITRYRCILEDGDLQLSTIEVLQDAGFLRFG